jgi:charged multivesicular body protein 1
MTQIMDQFEQQFEDMDVQSDYVESTINTTTALSTPQDQVDDLISEVQNIVRYKEEEERRVIPLLICEGCSRAWIRVK